MNFPHLAVEDRATVEDIASAYRLFLGRLPDPGGLEYFTRAVGEGMTLTKLARMFAEAPEFRERHNVETKLVEVDLGGYRVLVDPEESDIGRGVAASKDYEPHVRRAVARLFRAGQTFVDVGANVGCLSFLAAMIAGPAGSVIAIEPYPENLQRLFAGIALNGLDNVRVIPLAASDRRATFSLTGGTSNTYAIPAVDYKVPGVYAQSAVLDDLLADEPAVHVIKMDIEGHEPFAFRGLARTVARHDPILLTEFHPTCILRAGFGPVDYLRELLAHYRRLDVITPLSERETFDDAEALMRRWRERNAELAAAGVCLDGSHHFDIIATNRAA